MTSLRLQPGEPVSRRLIANRVLLLAVLASVLVAVSAGSPKPAEGDAATPVGDCTPGSDWGTTSGELASRVIDLVNEHRERMGLRRLQVSPTLTSASVWKALHMARFSAATNCSESRQTETSPY